eukprot:11219895-Lingulodinium_polyedra.AAC.1
MFASLPDPFVADPVLTAARRGSLGAFSREATRQQRQAAKAVDSGPSEGVLLHDSCPSEVRVYADRGVEWAEYLGHGGSAGMPELDYMRNLETEVVVLPEAVGPTCQFLCGDLTSVWISVRTDFL